MKKTFTLFIFFACIFASAEAKTVRVGYYKDAGNFMEGFSEADPKFGYAYEYLQNIASYTDWKYEYVYGYWDDLFEKLQKGEIDLLPDVSYMKNREKFISYPMYSMGTENYYLYSNGSRSSDISSDLNSLEGKTIWLGKNSYQYYLFKDWLSKTKINLNVVEMNYDDVHVSEFDAGKFDVHLSMDIVAKPQWEPIVKLGSSDIFLAVTKGRNDILNELNIAQEKLNVANPRYVTHLWPKYFRTIATSKLLTAEEQLWVKNHPVIKIGCLTDDMPFCNINKKTGEVEGLIRYLMDEFLRVFNLQSSVKYLFYDNFSDLQLALDAGRIDAVFPQNYDLFTSEKQENLLTRVFVTTSLGYVFLPPIDKDGLANKKIAVTEGRHAEKFTKSNYKRSKVLTYKNRDACLNAVLKDEADGAVFNNFKIMNYTSGRKKYKSLKVIEFPEHEELCFAVKIQNQPFLSMLNKLKAATNEDEISREISKNGNEKLNYSLRTFIEDYNEVVCLIAFLFLFVSIALISALDRLKMLINYDVLTHLLNRRRLDFHVKNAMMRAKSKNEVFSILLFDLDDFKKINDIYGHECGDEILKMVANTISKGVKRVDYVFRWGGEEFMVILKASPDIALRVAERIRKEIELQEVEYKQQKIKITSTVGIAAYKENLNVSELFVIADKNLYKGKAAGKNCVVI